jgi:hypothetical protein
MHYCKGTYLGLYRTHVLLVYDVAVRMAYAANNRMSALVCIERRPAFCKLIGLDRHIVGLISRVAYFTALVTAPLFILN